MLDKTTMDLFVPRGLRELLAAGTYGKRILEVGPARWRVVIDGFSDPVVEAIPRNPEAGRIVARSTVSATSCAYLEGTEAFRSAVDACRLIQAAARRELNHERK